MKTEIRIAGLGGQGVILAGYILGKTATIYQNKHATLTQSYGPESRGSACSACVIISDEEIFYPHLTNTDVGIFMSQDGYHKFNREAKDSALLFLDSDLVKPEEKDAGKLLFIPATQIAEKLGKKIVANMVILGFLARHSGIVTLEALREAVGSIVSKKHLELNLKALYQGYNYQVEKVR
ncbi:MAG: 2-oxoglutarate ferredoxin oxidoreductase subunit gamma [candidate division Zixibacteria bacterium RBG-1]|nr:MAG: 2-oxoglutarate ferredoxin oxidoreductase subunit gamma [candidate division Zixibacteria bacterium RBG-1]OGC83814.1 MAG: pyruvate ferredoxin oxidoreductase [candidate division Zixibacteria bacterium RBG_19FT_COMBO_42_43]